MINYICILILVHAAIAYSEVTSAYNIPYCVSLIDNVYCYSGNTNGTREIYSLKFGDDPLTNKSDSEAMWTILSTDTRFSHLNDRVNFQSTFNTGDGKWLIQGGQSNDSSFTEHPFILYDAINDTWSSLTDYRQHESDYAPISGATSFYVSSLKKYMFYGGRSGFDSSSTEIKQSRYGFLDLTTYDIDTKTWDTLETIQHDHYQFNMRSVYSPAYDKVYLMGGQRAGLDSGTSERVLFDQIVSVHFPEYAWETHHCTGDIPEYAEYFTATLLPDNTSMILCGDYAYLHDFCYVLDLNTLIWRQLSIGKQSNQHSAVLAGDILYIISGITHQMLILDVSDSHNIRLYQSPEPESVFLDNNNTLTTSSSTRPHMRPIVIAVIIVGCIIIFFSIIKLIKGKGVSVNRRLPDSVEPRMVMNPAAINVQRQPSSPPQYDIPLQYIPHPAQTRTDTSMTAPPPYAP